MAHAREWVAMDGPVKVELIHEDDGAGNTHVLRHVQDVDPILDQNQRMASYEQHGTRVMGAKLAASTPFSTYFIEWPIEFRRRYGVHPHHPDLSGVPAHEHSARRREVAAKWERFKRDKLNDRDNSKLRIWKGRL